MRILALLVLVLLSAGADERALATEWAQLREVKGHFQGGEWSDASDAWTGRKHQVLAELGELLGKPGTPESRIRELLGEPDRSDGAPVQAPPGSTVLVYQWRGMHDFLYFVCAHGQVTRSGWWMAYE